jgi:hypothetical protein
LKHISILRNRWRDLAASYSILFSAHYRSETLRSALPQMTKANPKLLASGTYYVAEAEPGNLIVGRGGWTAARPGSGEIVEGHRHFATHQDLVRRGVGANLLDRAASAMPGISVYAN